MIDISLYSLMLSLHPVAGVIWIAARWTAKGREVLFATLRMLIQLLIVGYVLIFVFSAESFWIGIAVIVLMIVVSSSIAIRTTLENRFATFLKALCSISVIGISILVFVLYGVLRLDDPLSQPRIIIPIAGMIFSTAMTAITLAVERFEREYADGANYKTARNAAWSAALIPQINVFLAVGLVSLPGMMTGQILSGVDPLVAVRYQIVVMAMLLQASAFSVALFLWMMGGDD